MYIYKPTQNWVAASNIEVLDIETSLRHLTTVTEDPKNSENIERHSSYMLHYLFQVGR